MIYQVLFKDGRTVRYICTVRYATISAKKYGTLVRNAFFVMVLVRYVGALFEFAHWTFYVQRVAVNEDSCDRARRAYSLGYSQVIITAP